MKQKLKLLLQPYLGIAIIFTIVYCFTCWLLFMQLNLIDADEDLINFWLPFLLPWIPILIWLKPRIRLLKLKRDGRRSPDFGYMMIAAFAIAIPTFIAMQYLQTATGKLTTLTTINEITVHQPTKYYKLKSFYIDKYHHSTEYTADVSGRYNNELNFHIYIACPIYETGDNVVRMPPATSAKENDTVSNNQDTIKQPLIVVDGKVITKAKLETISPDSINKIAVLKGKSATALFGSRGKNGVVLVTTKNPAVVIDEVAPPPPPPKAWLCVKYGKQVSNNLNSSEKENIEHSFYEESLQAFENADLNSFTYLERIGNNKARKGYKKAIDKLSLSGVKLSDVILEPQYGNFSKRNGNKLAWTFGAFGIALGVWLLLILLPKLDDEKLNIYFNNEHQLNESADQSLKSNFRSYFIPRTGYYITPLLIDINIIVFILMVLSGVGFISFDVNELLKWGANYKPYTINGEWWRLLSSIFIHGGLIHLLSNMYALLFIGILLEPKLDRNNYAFCYLILGVIASGVSLWWHTATVSVGASGAIFGLYGILLALLLTKAVSKDFNKAFLASIIIFITYNLIIGFASEIVDNAAHIGGLIAGFITGLILSPSIKRKNENAENAV